MTCKYYAIMLIAFSNYIVHLQTYREDPGTLLKLHCASLLSNNDEEVRRINVQLKYSGTPIIRPPEMWTLR